MKLACVVLLAAAAVRDSDSRSDGLREVGITSSFDGQLQKALFYAPAGAQDENAEPAPLAVALHQWSSGYAHETSKEYFEECRRRGWIMIHPDFRGPNFCPSACASNAAVRDVLDAVEYAKAHARVDQKRIYVLGGSGGGHMTLMMAAKAPELWAAASAWVPISDLAAWHAETKKAKLKYCRDLELVCGGPPGASAAVDEQYRLRSPLTHLRSAAGLPVDINAGIHDGHTGSVPVGHSLRAFNLLAEANGEPGKAVSGADIAFMQETREVPEAILYGGPQERNRRHLILLRREAGPTRVTIFEGGHDMDVPVAMDWLSTKSK
ncbi:MAG TPA: prolyl oligopeptidase family serine peptidase [Candidatus Brocadiia bacterium]|nr:prolyl oligopeptidase family serine peptidase [Candidatus Brocadiia bacterium]